MKQQGKFTGSPQTKILGNHQFKTKSAIWLTLIYIHHCSWCPRGTGAHPEPWRKKKNCRHLPSQIKGLVKHLSDFRAVASDFAGSRVPPKKKKRALQHSNIDMESQWFSRENDLQCWCVHIYLNLLGSSSSLPHVLADVVHQPHPKTANRKARPTRRQSYKISRSWPQPNSCICTHAILKSSKKADWSLAYFFTYSWRFKYGEKCQNPIRILMNIKIAKKSLDLCTVIPPEYDIKMYCSFWSTVTFRRSSLWQSNLLLCKSRQKNNRWL